jgi:hypothetical protein
LLQGQQNSTLPAGSPEQAGLNLKNTDEGKSGITPGELKNLSNVSFNCKFSIIGCGGEANEQQLRVLDTLPFTRLDR